MPAHTKTSIEQRVDELSRDLSVAASEYDEARRHYDNAGIRWDEAKYAFNVTKVNLETYLAGLEDPGEAERSGLLT